MYLFEITTGSTGMSYERAYVWAQSDERAMMLFRSQNSGNKKISRCDIQKLFSSTDSEFCTNLSTDGWERGQE